MPTPVFIKHCPRCDRPSISRVSDEDAMKMMLTHVKLAHRDYFTENDLGDDDG